MSKFTYVILFVTGLILLSSCKTQHSALYDPKEVSHLSKKLDIPIVNTDKLDDKNMLLYAETSLWLGTPYRYGGVSKNGIDCSGFVNNVYKKVYAIKLPRSTSELSSASIKKIKKEDLITGDLVFFSTTKDKKKITHVGIYLKDSKFIHASTSKGVIVSSLREGYYLQNFIRGGRVK